MNKRTAFLSIALLVTLKVFSGGILENTNQSINFLRNPSRDATIGIDGVYSNPAGVAFIDDGWHLQLNWMMVHQDRDTWSGFEFPGYGKLLQYNAKIPAVQSADYRKKYEGNVDVPCQPSLNLVYNKKDWSFQFGFGFVGGGGGCEYADGIGSFESLVAMSGISALAKQGMKMKTYSLDSYMKGTSYDLGITLGAARRITDKISAYAGLRSIVLLNNYKGHLKDIAFTVTNGMEVTGEQYLLDCRQNAFGIAPIIGIDYRINNHWNVAAKYEFRTKLNAKTTADNSENFTQLAQTSSSFAGYVDRAETRQDLPAYFSFGVQYSPIPSVNICGGYHRYFDADTKQFSADKVDDTNEMTLGIEYRIMKHVEVSGGMQKTWYHVDDSFNTDASFVLNSYTLGCGVGVDLSKMVTLNLAYFQTNYKNKEVMTTTETGLTTSTKYRRSNRIIGVGIDINF